MSDAHDEALAALPECVRVAFLNLCELHPEDTDAGRDIGVLLAHLTTLRREHEQQEKAAKAVCDDYCTGECGQCRDAGSCIYRDLWRATQAEGGRDG